MATKKRAQAKAGWWEGFRAQELFLLAVALLPLVYMPNLLDLYDMAKRACMNLLALSALAWQAVEAIRLGVPMTIAGGPLAWPAAAYLLALVAASTQAVNFQDALDGSLQQGMPIVLAGILLARGISPMASERFISAAIFAAAVATSVGFAQFCGVDTESWGIRQVIKPASLFGNKNMAAEYILMVLPFVLYRCEVAGFAGPYLALATFVLSFLFVGYTKAVWVGTAVVLGFVAWRVFRTEHLRERVVASAPFLVAALVGFFLLINAHRFGNVEGVGGLSTLEVAAKGTGYSAEVRFALWENSIPMFFERPLLGVAPGNWYIYYPRFAFARRHDPTFSTVAQAEHPHNDLVQVVGETGLVGLLAFLAVLLVVFKLIVFPGEEQKPAQAARHFYIALSILGVLLDGIFAYPMHLAPGAGHFWIGAVLLIAGLGSFRSLAIPGGAASAVVMLLVVSSLMVREVQLLRANATYRDAAIELAGNKNEVGAKILEKSIALDPHRYRTHSVLGRTMAQLRRSSDAIAEYRKALECHPNQINVLYNLAHTLWAAGQQEESLKMLDRALAVVPRFQEGLYLKATYLKEQGKKVEALEVFQKLTVLVPKFADAFNEAGNLLKEARRYTEAEESYRGALAVKPDYGEVQNNLGVVYLEQGRNREAADCFRKAIEQAPKYAGSYFNLGRSLSLLGQNAEALEAYRSFALKWEGDPGTLDLARKEAQRIEAFLNAQKPVPILAVPVTPPAVATPSIPSPSSPATPQATPARGPGG